MKLQEVVFPRPVKVLQIFTNVNIYRKDQKSFDDRKEKLSWKPIASKSGHVNDGILYLPEKILQQPDFKNCDMITIEDDNIPRTKASSNRYFTNHFDSGFTRAINHCFQLFQPVIIEIFRIRKEQELELELNYDYFDVGIPQRKNFKLCELKKNQPVEIKINGKIDSSMSAGTERTYKEQTFILEYLGDFEKSFLFREPSEPMIKEVPAQRKVVDLIKELW